MNALHLPAPRLNPMFRLQWEETQQAYVLLYPEGMVRLNPSAAEILKRCDGAHATAEIVSDLESLFDVQHIGPEVHAFLEHAAVRGWLNWSS